MRNIIFQNMKNPGVFDFSKKCRTGFGECILTFDAMRR